MSEHTLKREPGGWFNKKIPSYQYRKSHCGDKTILRPSYLHNGISYTGKMTSLYWIRAQIIGCLCQRSLYQRTESSLVQITACRLFSATQVAEPVLTYCRLNLENKMWNLNQNTFFMKMYWNMLAKCQTICPVLKAHQSTYSPVVVTKSSAVGNTHPYCARDETLQWRHNGRDGVSNHQPLTIVYWTVYSGADPRHWQVTGEFPAQRVSNAENISILWRHRDSRCQRPFH